MHVMYIYVNQLWRHISVQKLKFVHIYSPQTYSIIHSYNCPGGKKSINFSSLLSLLSFFFL